MKILNLSPREIIKKMKSHAKSTGIKYLESIFVTKINNKIRYGQETFTDISIKKT
jgi:hypothetical protein